MKLLVGGVAAAAALVLAAAPALASTVLNQPTTVVKRASVTVHDGSFEDTPAHVVANPVAGTTIPGWTVSRGNVDWVGSYWQAADGRHSIDLNGHRPGTISTRFPTTAGATYLVQFALSGNPDGGPTVKRVMVVASGGVAQTFSYDTAAEKNTRVAMKWKTEGYVFRADSASTALTFISKTGRTGSHNPYGPALDNVTVTRILARGSDCKRGGWRVFQALGPDGSWISFRNQGQCVSYFARRGVVPVGP